MIELTVLRTGLLSRGWGTSSAAHERSEPASRSAGSEPALERGHKLDGHGNRGIPELYAVCVGSELLASSGSTEKVR